MRRERKEEMDVDGETDAEQSRAIRERRLVVLSSLVVVTLAVVIVGCSTQRRHAEAVMCGNQMIAIGLGARIWADDNGGQMPRDMLSMSNELATPKILICPSDYSRHAATNWNSFSSNNCSYEMVGNGLRGDTNTTFLRCTIHGYVLLGDGAVFDGKRRLEKGVW